MASLDPAQAVYSYHFDATGVLSHEVNLGALSTMLMSNDTRKTQDTSSPVSLSSLLAASGLHTESAPLAAFSLASEPASLQQT